MKKENIFNERDVCTGAAGLPAQRVGTGPARRPYESPLVTVVSFKMERGFSISSTAESLSMGNSTWGSSNGFLEDLFEGNSAWGSSRSSAEGLGSGSGAWGSSGARTEGLGSGSGAWGSGGAGTEGLGSGDGLW